MELFAQKERVKASHCAFFAFFVFKWVEYKLCHAMPCYFLAHVLAPVPSGHWPAASRVCICMENTTGHGTYPPRRGRGACSLRPAYAAGMRPGTALSLCCTTYHIHVCEYRPPVYLRGDGGGASWCVFCAATVLQQRIYVLFSFNGCRPRNIPHHDLSGNR